MSSGIVSRAAIHKRLGEANQLWETAIDAGRSLSLHGVLLSNLADAAEQMGHAVRLLELSGGTWGPRKEAAGAEFPYQLSPYSRRPEHPLWTTFDEHTAELGNALASGNPIRTARAFESICDVARTIAADLIEEERAHLNEQLRAAEKRREERDVA